MVNNLDPSLPVDFPGYNTSGSTIPAFSAVRISGAATYTDYAQPFATIELAQADAAGNMPCDGVTTAEIEDGAIGTVRTFGAITDIDTSAFTDGDSLFIDEATPGGFVASIAGTTGITQRVGTVLLSDATAGVIFVAIRPDMDGFTTYTNRDTFEIFSSTPTSALRMHPSGGELVLAAIPTGNRVLTLPDATDKLVGKATTDTLTNKTFDTAGAGNSLLINGLAATANTGTGAVARADSPVFTTEITTPSVHILSSGAAFDTKLEVTEALTADRQLRLILNDADRRLTMAGDATISGTNTGDQTLTEVIALADLTDVTAKTGTGTTVVMQGSPALTTPTIADLTNATHTHTNAAGGGLLQGLSQLMDTSGRCVRSTLPNANTGFLLTSGTAYFVYLGRVTVTSTFAFARFSLRIAGVGAQTAEVGFFSSPTAPSRANQTITKLAATGTVDDLTTLGVKANTTTLGISVAAGTHLWVGVRTAMATTQPSLYGLIGDRSHGRILSTAASGALTGAGPWTGAIITDGGTTLAPDMDGALD